MAGYSKGIVDTRKLNKNSKAKLGRRGDTKIREVDNKDSHVNALEAYLIDVNGKAGEEYAKRVGAGTVNPLTGMPEYHPEGARGHTHDEEIAEGTIKYVSLGKHQGSQEQTYINGQWVNTGGGSGGVEGGTEAGVTGDETYQTYAGSTGRQDYQTLSDPDFDLEGYLKSEFDIGADKMQYIEGFQQEPFGFLGETQALTTRGLQSAYGTTMGALGSQQATLGRSMGLGITQATQSAGQATRKSNMAFSGTITQGLEAQKKQLFQDYSAGMGDIKRERGTALDTLTLGKEGAGLDFRQAEYTEQQRQLDELYADVAAIPA